MNREDTMAYKAPGKLIRSGISLQKLFKIFPDDQTSEQWFIEQRWPNGIRCPECGTLNVQSRCRHTSMPFRCREKQCAKRFSVKTGTVMQWSKLGYQVWLVALYLFSTDLKSVSSMTLHRELNITRKAAWHLAHRVKEALGDGL